MCTLIKYCSLLITFDTCFAEWYNRFCENIYRKILYYEGENDDVNVLFIND